MRKDMRSRTGLGLTQHQVAQLGGFGVVRETFKLFYCPHLLLVQFAFVLPLNILAIVYVYGYVNQYILSSIFTDMLTLDQPPTRAVIVNNITSYRSSWLQLSFTASVLIVFLISALAVEAVIYSTVGSIYSGTNLTLAQVFKSVPRMCKKLFVTTFYVFLVIMGTTFVSGILLVGSFQYLESAPLLSLFFLFSEVFVFSGLFAFSLLLRVAVGVSCYEENYGLAAYYRGKKLMERKWRSAIRLSVICQIPLIMVSFSWSQYVIFYPGSPLTRAWSFNWTNVVLGVIFILICSWLDVFVRVAWAVFYFSCSEKHKEDNMTPDVEAGYQPIAELTKQ